VTLAGLLAWVFERAQPGAGITNRRARPRHRPHVTLAELDQRLERIERLLAAGSVDERGSAGTDRAIVDP
jgi:hypothetical protein